MRLRVVLRPRRDDRASFFAHQPVCSRVDLPALGRPMRATKPARIFPREGGFAPLPAVVTRLTARSSLPPPSFGCAGKAGVSKACRQSRSKPVPQAGEGQLPESSALAAMA